MPKRQTHVEGDHVADCHPEIDDGQYLAEPSEQNLSIAPLE